MVGVASDRFAFRTGYWTKVNRMPAANDRFGSSEQALPTLSGPWASQQPDISTSGLLGVTGSPQNLTGPVARSFETDRSLC